MDALERHARTFVETALAKVAPEAAPDIDAASLFVYDEDDDPERPTATVGFNTEETVASELEDEPDEVTEAFVEMLVRVVRSLHADGVVDRIFGRPVPVLIHELEYYEEIAEQNARANPGELAGGLRDWIEATG
jgi:hypothetical protein